MTVAPSLLSIIAAAFYLLVVLAVGAAGVRAGAAGQPNWHRAAWFGLAALFVLLALWRVLALEEIVRAELRDSLRGSGAYEMRRSYQSIIASALVALAGIAGFAAAWRARAFMRGRRNLALLAALAAGGGLVLLVAFRLVSFHWVDALLYGPLKLNWFADIGLSVAVMFAAVFYVRLLRSSR